jgi:hypothetical protein
MYLPSQGMEIQQLETRGNSDGDSSFQIKMISGILSTRVFNKRVPAALSVLQLFSLSRIPLSRFLSLPTSPILSSHSLRIPSSRISL